MSNLPKPFDDVVDPRSKQQRLDDQRRVRGVAGAQAVAAPVNFQRLSTILEKVIARRPPAGGVSSIRVERGVPIQPLDTTSGRQTLAVPNERIVRMDVIRNTLRLAAGLATGDDDPPIPDDGANARANDPAWLSANGELTALTPDLASRLGRVPEGADLAEYLPPGQGDLPSPQPEAVPNLVAMLHMVGPPSPSTTTGGGPVHQGDVIIKSPGGATKTAVEKHPGPISPQAAPIIVAIIDTGIAVEKRGDGWLADVDRSNPDSIDRLDAFPVTEPPQVGKDGNGFLDLGAGHGTFVAGIVRQVDPEALIKVYRAMDSDGFGSELAAAAAMVMAASEKAHVINLSLGTSTPDGKPSPVFEAALDVIDMLRPGDRPAIVAAAGNSGDDTLVWPAASQRVIAVAGLTPDGAGAPWSTRGSWVDVSTIGEGIVSTYVQGKEDPDLIPRDQETFPGSAWAMWTGTSFAAPQISAAISRTCRTEGCSPQEAADRVIAQGKIIDAAFGAGLEFLPGT